MFSVEKGDGRFGESEGGMGKGNGGGQDMWDARYLDI